MSENIRQEPKVLGEWTTGHYAMAVLKLLDTEETCKLYYRHLMRLDSYEKKSIEALIVQIANYKDSK